MSTQTEITRLQNARNTIRTWLAALTNPRTGEAMESLTKRHHRKDLNTFLKRAVAEGWDLDAPEPERQFFYLPYEHSEDPADQAAAVRLIGERLPETGAETLLHARAHQAIIARFGRFPFRNAALGREDTAAEAAFLAEGGYAAEVRRLGG